ncbi:MAG TPA: calcium-binding protein [Terriglobales bacterium]
MGRKSKLWAGITSWKISYDSLSPPAASRPRWCRRSAREKPSRSSAWRPKDACAGDMLVLIRWQGRNVAVPLSQLVAIDADESTLEAIGDWHYWLAQGYCF